ncbi:hypothetical protein [Pantoea sp. EKM20T]|uniref:hypothetical protein n=1 Tax=Pantoea sp. EKM20T TaxID=2708059 RepID=UPI00142E44CC|nr:hypothetical protein [Pantoea sp. EKM20T]KAF6677119.1 hypothetical protein HFD94_19670 [Pantoea sp. EKM20T]
MNQFLNALEGLNLPFQEETSMLLTVTSSPVRKIFAEAWKSYQSKKYWTSCLCLFAGTAYVTGIAVLVWWLFPALKAMLVAKLALSPPVAHAICWGIKRALRWGFGKIVDAISRKGASNTGCKP